MSVRSIRTGRKEGVMKLGDYKWRLEAANTKAEIRDITYQAFISDENALSGKTSLYDKVIKLAVKREFEIEAKEKTLPLYSHLYTLLYEDKIPESYEMIEAGEKWMSENPEYLDILVRQRGDLFTSDREINALALALNLEPAS